MMMRAGFIALLGAPNAGKSTLLNTLIGSNISIITHKVQTTRFPVRGILTTSTAQMIFVDTPGFCQLRGSLNKMLLKIIKQQTQKADLLAFIIDVTKDIPEPILSLMLCTQKKVFIILNKIDLVKKQDLLPLMLFFQKNGFDRIYPISALKSRYRKHLDVFVQDVENFLPESPFLFSKDSLTDCPSSLMASEITRKVLFDNIHQEIPYSLHVETIRMKKDDKDNGITVEQVIYVTHESLRPIIIGKHGKTIKLLGSQARFRMIELFHNKIHLFLSVKIAREQRLLNQLQCFLE